MNRIICFAIGAICFAVHVFAVERPSRELCTLERAISNSKETRVIEFNGKIANMTTAQLYQLSYSECAGQMFGEPSVDVPKSIIYITYSCSTSVEQTVKVFYEKGISAHFVISKDGEIFKLVDPKKVAYATGRSAYRDLIGLNQHSISIILNHPATTEFGSCDDTCVKVKGYPYLWIPYPDRQIESATVLIGWLQNKYQIPGWNVVSRGDTSGRAGPAPGPLFSYKSMSDYGAGYWPKEIIDCPTELSDEDVKLLIQAIGYNLNSEFAFNGNVDAMVISFKNHFGLKDLTSDITPDTKNMAYSVVIDRLTRNDPITWLMDNYLIDKLKEIAERNDRIKRLLQHFNMLVFE